MDNDALRAQVTEAAGRSFRDAPVLQLKGDASNRSYLRVGTYPESFVVMVMPKEGAKSEEATKGGPPPELPFVNVHRYLTQLGVRVPRILRYDEPAGVMVLEDLGDVTFEKALQTQDRDALYTQAIDLLVELRSRAEKEKDPTCLAFTREFDADLYDWEFHHFREWGLEAWSGKTPTPAERAELDRIFRALSETLASAPKGFTHRDYQSRNLMLKDGELVVIDFQDALLGPRQYDLVALLRDSYVELPLELVDRMLERYCAKMAVQTGQRVGLQPFKAFFDLLTVQRKLKDAGRFEYIHRVKGNPGFLVSIPASLRYVKAAFARCGDNADVARLQEICARYVPELG